MFESIGRSWNLMQKSFSVLKKDKELLVFPLLSGFFGILLFLGLVGAFMTFNEENSLLAYFSLFVFYFLSSFIIIFFNSALIGAANIRLKGGDPTLKDGINIALAHIVNIVGWALISATVGIILRSLQNKARNNLLAGIVVGIIGGIWSAITYFVIPVMVIENLGPLAAIKRSTEIVKKKFGEVFIAGIGFGLISSIAFVVLFLGFLAVTFVVGPFLGVTGIFVLLGLFILILLVISISVMALEGIFVASLYHYAETGDDSAELGLKEMIKEQPKP